MNKTEFYHELMSNSTDFPENTVANFKNRVSLLHPLTNNWLVGVKEISYSKTWKNVKQDMIICIENDAFSAILSSDEKTIYSNRNINKIECYHLKSGNYESVQMLCTEIEKQFKKLSDKSIISLPKFEYDNITKLISILPGKHNNGSLLMPRLNKEIYEILGFEKYSSTKPKYTKDFKCVADRPAELEAGLKTLYVYADLIEPQYIGDTKAKLLKSIEVPDDKPFGSTIVVRYNDPDYVPVLVTDFHSIQIDIKDDTGERVQFMFGRTRIKLHFKQLNG